jgi:hypothetical protein
MRKIRGQLGVGGARPRRARAVHRPAPAARGGAGAINSLMAELMEDHILHHMTGKAKSSADAAADLIEIVRSHLK